ncbi:MAG: hypothetical protein ACXV3F_07205 [Frankiaceae bacterium]
MERTYANLNHAEANLYRLSELDFLWSNLPNILTHATINLPGDDLRRRRLQLIYDRCYQQPGSIRECERSAIVAAYQGANEAARKEQLRVRGFRNVILATAVIAALLAAGVIALTAFNDTKSWLPLCFAPPNKVVCATTEATRIPEESVTEAVKRTVGAWDTAVIEFVGLLGATISATAALRNMRASADPYSLSVAVAVLKLPTGALTAFLGLLLIRAGFVPGLSDLDSSAQIIAWAIVLGSAQQLFTRFVDAQASTVLGRAAASLGELYPHQQTPSTARIPVYESRQVDITDGRPTPPFTPEAPALQKRRRRKPPA